MKVFGKEIGRLRDWEIGAGQQFSIFHFQFLIFPILLLAAILRFHALTASSLWSDEGNTWALMGRSFAQIARDAAADIHPPGYYWLLKMWTLPFGDSAFALRSFSAVLGIILVILVYAIVQKLMQPSADHSANLRASQVRDLAGPPQKILGSTRRVTDPARARGITPSPFAIRHSSRRPPRRPRPLPDLLQPGSPHVYAAGRVQCRAGVGGAGRQKAKGKRQRAKVGWRTGLDDWVLLFWGDGAMDTL